MNQDKATLPPQPAFNLSWLLLMAWRDSRRSRPRLLLFGSSVVLGIAALVSIYSLSDNLSQNVDQQAATLLGSDLEISGNKPATETIIASMDSISETKSREIRFASMVYFPASQGTRLVQVRALDGGFPYYGTLETKPASAGKSFRDKRGALVDQTLMLQYGAKPGDSIRVGNYSYVIEGTLAKAPGQTGFATSVSPVVYVPLRYLDSAGLIQKGSRINYLYHLKTKQALSVSAIRPDFEQRLENADLDIENIESTKRDSARSFEDLENFLQLVALIALLLGCIGVASAIHIYVREKISMIALLRCVGVRSSQAFTIYTIQILGMALISSVTGALLGAGLQQLLPNLLQDFLPFRISTTLSWGSIAQGIGIGLVISILFALLPLLSIRHISPLSALRRDVQEQSGTSRDPMRWFIYLAIGLFLALLIQFQVGNWSRTAVFIISIVASLLLLAGVALLLMWLVRRFFPTSWSFVWRQGLSNLYRPNNQTLVLVISLGLGTTFICMLFFMQSLVLNKVNLTVGGDQPNIVLFDIQPKQKEGILSIAKSNGLPLFPMVPVVNMRLKQLNDRTDDQAREDTSRGGSRRLFSREYRVTYRDSLAKSEQVTAGTWQGRAGKNEINISLEEGFARQHKIKIGDRMVFNVQGAMITTRVGSTRSVDWNQVQTNFLVVFPAGVLEEAPQFHVFLTRVPSVETSAAFQQQVVRSYPNVSIVDLALVLDVISQIMEKISLVVRFIAGFSIATALVVLIASVLISKFQRMRESVLLRTLGASRRQILAITALEYLFLGALSAMTGILISLLGSWAMAIYIFETDFTIPFLPVLALFALICILTMLIGMYNSRSIVNKSPLAVLGEI